MKTASILYTLAFLINLRVCLVQCISSGEFSNLQFVDLALDCELIGLKTDIWLTYS